MQYFTEDEFKCKCGCGLDITDKFKAIIYKARKLANTPFIINSGARCKDYNATIPHAKPTSSHVAGVAVDIRCSGSRKRSLIMNAFCKVGVDRFGIDENFLHVDIDTEKDKDVTWLYI